MLNDTNWEFLRHLTNFSCQNKVVNWVAFTFFVGIQGSRKFKPKGQSSNLSMAINPNGTLKNTAD